MGISLAKSVSVSKSFRLGTTECWFGGSVDLMRFPLFGIEEAAAIREPLSLLTGVRLEWITSCGRSRTYCAASITLVTKALLANWQNCQQCEKYYAEVRGRV